MVTKPVFISYATATQGAAATALEKELGPALAYRDTSDLSHGQPFPTQLFDAIAGCSVFVCLLDARYAQSWFCRAELGLALDAAPLQNAGSPAYPHIVVGLPEHPETAEQVLLPPRVREGHWPRITDTEALARLIRERLAACAGTTVEQRVGALKIRHRQRELEDEALLWPRQIADPSVPQANLPKMPEETFYGRAALLDAIHRRLTTGAEAAGVALVAQGGAGKTRLATEYLYRFGTRHFPGGLFWVNAANAAERDNAFYGILQSLIPDLPPLATLLEKQLDLGRRIREKLAERGAGPALWIIDNLPEPLSGQPPEAFTHWCPAGPGQVAVLATSRQRQFPEGINLEVDALPRDAAGLLLCRDMTVGMLTAEEEARIATAVGDWPLALELLNASFARRVLSPSEFLQQHERGRVTQVLDDTMDRLRDQVPPDALRGVSETLILSSDRLPSEARALALALAHFAEVTPLPTALLDALPAPLDHPTARATLVGRCFVVRPDRDVLGVMLPLVADFFRLQDRDREGLEAAWQGFLALSGTIAPGSGGSHALGPHGAALLRATPEPSARTVTLARWLGEAGIADGNSRIAAPFLARGSADAESVFGPDDPAVLELRDRWAAALHGSGDLQSAMVVEQETIERSSRTRGPSHPLTLDLQLALGRSQWAANELSLAEATLASTLAGLGEACGESHPSTLVCARTYAWLLWNQGRLEEARARLEPLVAQLTEALGPTHHDTLRAMHSLAIVRRDLGEFTGSQELLERLLAVREEVYGPAHSHTFWTLHSLGLVYAATGHRVRAGELLLRALHGFQAALGEDHLDTLSVVGDYAANLREQGDRARALQLLERAMERAEAVVSPRHIVRLLLGYILAVTLLEEGTLDRARKVLDEIYPEARAVLKLSHPLLGEIAHVYGLLEWECGNRDAARAYLLEAERLFAGSLPAGHPERERLTLDRARLEAAG